MLEILGTKTSPVLYILLAFLILAGVKLSRRGRVPDKNKKKNAGTLFLASVTFCGLFCGVYAFSRAQYLIFYALAAALAAVSSALVYRRST
jgi:hypothetical protein